MSGAKIDTSVATLQKIEKGIQPPISVTIPESCRLSGLGLSTIYKKIDDGTLESTTIGKRRLIFFASLMKMIESGRSLPSGTRQNWKPPNPALRRASDEADTDARMPRPIRRRRSPPA